MLCDHPFIAAIALAPDNAAGKFLFIGYRDIFYTSFSLP